MKQIKLQSNFIEVPIVDDDNNTVLKIKFNKTDESIKRLYSEKEKIQKLAEEIEDDFKDADQAKEFIKTAIDATFEEGTFDALYKLNPSRMIVAIYYMQLCQAVQEELDNSISGGQELIDKYLNR